MLNELLEALKDEEAKQIKEIQEKFAKRSAVIESAVEKFKMLGVKGEEVLRLARLYTTAQLFYASLSVTVEDFRVIKKAFGCLRKSDVSPAERKRRTVYVTLRPIDPNFSGVTFTYEHKLRKTDKCKIVRVTKKEVQCSID